VSNSITNKDFFHVGTPHKRTLDDGKSVAGTWTCEPEVDAEEDAVHKLIAGIPNGGKNFFDQSFKPLSFENARSRRASLSERRRSTFVAEEGSEEVCTSVCVLVLFSSFHSLG
jgi:hypothetical protein